MNYTSSIRWKHLGVDISSSVSIYELTFGTLRVLSLHHMDFDLVIVLYLIPEKFYCLRLIILYGDDSLCMIKQIDTYLKSQYQLVRFLHHPSVIRSKIWLTLCAIYYYVVDRILILWGQLDICRETGAAHSYYSGLLDDLLHILSIQSGQIFYICCKVDLLKQAIILYNY